MTTLRDKLIAYELFRKRSGITPTTDSEIEELVDQFIAEDHKNYKEKERKGIPSRKGVRCKDIPHEECMKYEFCKGCPGENDHLLFLGIDSEVEEDREFESL